MKIFLIGATGGTGREVLTKLLEAKYDVIALARNPADLMDVINNHLKIIKGNVYNPETFEEELKNCEVVISTLGKGTSLKKTEIYSEGGQNIISAMRKANIKRLITLTAAAFDPTDPGNKSFLVKYIVQPLFKRIYSDMKLWENVLEKSQDIAWTCIRPSRLTNGREKGNYRIQLNHCPQGGGKISRKDLAGFITHQINSDKYINQKVAIAY